MKKENLVLLLSAFALGLASCGSTNNSSSTENTSAPESVNSSDSVSEVISQDESVSETTSTSEEVSDSASDTPAGMNKETWANAFNADLTENLTTTLTYTTTSITGEFMDSYSLIQYSYRAGDKCNVSQDANELVTLDTTKTTMGEFELEDTIDYYIYYAEDYDYDEDTGIYSFYMSDSYFGYAVAKDEDTHYEYSCDDDEYTKTVQLYSYDDIIADNILTFADFAFEYENAVYDAENDSYTINDVDEYIMDVTDASTITDASASVLFDENNHISLLTISFTADDVNYLYSLSFEDYGTTEVYLPEDYYECDHEGYSTYDEYDETYHYSICSYCTSVLTTGKHEFDENGVCTICENEPTYSVYESIGNEYCSNHIAAEFNYVTDELRGISLSSFDDSDTDVSDDESTITYTYWCEDCNLVATIAVTTSKDENCLVTYTYVYSFYDTTVDSANKIINDITLTESEYDHNYEENIVSLGNCQYKDIYTCADCNDVQEDYYYEHNFEVVSYDEDTYSGSVQCKDCGLTVDAEILNNTDYDIFLHEFWIDYYNNGQEYSQYFYELHDADEDGYCKLCDCPVYVTAYEPSYDPASPYYYHAYLNILEDDETVDDYYFLYMDEDVNDEETEGVFTCEDCDFRVIFTRTCEGECERTYTSTWEMYDGDTLLKTIKYYQTITDHTWEEEPETTKDGCTVTETYHCLYCDEVYEITYEDHDFETTCEVDEATGEHHVVTKCNDCDYVEEDTIYDGHVYASYGHADTTDHCFEIKELKCQYCGEVVATTIGDFFNHDTADKVICTTEDYGDFYVTECKNCGAFDSCGFTECEDLDWSSEWDEETYRITSTTYTNGYNVTYSYSTQNYNDNECIKEVWATVTITNDKGETIYTNSYVAALEINHVDGCEATQQGEYGWYIVYLYDCGYVEIY